MSLKTGIAVRLSRRLLNWRQHRPTLAAITEGTLLVVLFPFAVIAAIWGKRGR